MRLALFSLAVVGAMLSNPGSASAAPTFTPDCGLHLCGWISEDGSRVVFPFYEELTPRAGRAQVYERVDGTTRALIKYPADPPTPTYAAPLGISANADHVFIWTNLALTPDDQDGNTSDVYDISSGRAAVLSTGPMDDHSSLDSGGTPFQMFFAGASADGSRVFLDTMSPVVAADTDACPDIYERASGQTMLVSTGPTASASFPSPQCDLARFAGLSADGSHVFFSSYDSLVPTDEGGNDIYQRVGGQVSVLTDYPDEDGGCVDMPGFGDASADGSTVLFSTNMRILPEDQDRTGDVYERRPDGVFVLVSRGSEGPPAGEGCAMFAGDTPIAISADGRTSIFSTDARLSPADGDSSSDIYSVTDGSQPQLVTTGPSDPSLDQPIQRWTVDVSDDASRIAFETDQRLVGDDEDQALDVYLRSPDRTALISTGPEASQEDRDAKLIGISGDGETIGFSTGERMTSEDGDRAADIYLRQVNATGSAGGGPSASKVARRGPRTVLVSAESIAPRMSIGAGSLVGPKRAQVRIGCPKAERSGPCHGLLTLKGGGTRGVAGFQIRPGTSRRLTIRLRHRVSGRSIGAKLRVRGVDRLGNARTVRRRVQLRGL